MTRSPDRLYDLLPVIHRQRDAERGEPLRALLRVIAEQVGVLEDDIETLYENWFLETCQDWVVPYLGDLVGHTAGTRVLSPRADVANTIRHRRRKGTLAILELLARDVAGWPARAVEFSRLLAVAGPRVQRATADLRNGNALDLLDGPFDSLAHTVDVRRLGSTRSVGRHNIPSVGLFVWRLRAYPVSNAPAYCREQVGAHAYTFSVLGNDAPLFTKPAPEPSDDHIAGQLNVPAPIRRRALERNPSGYYGPSFLIWAEDWAGNVANTPLPAEAIIVADLSDWQYRPPRGHVAVDPVLGRLAFPVRQLPRKGVWVRYHYGFSDDLGGGEYRRTVRQPNGATVYRVGHGQRFERIIDALACWQDEKPRHAVVEITDGGVYTEQITIELAEGQSIQLRAADRTRPVLRLMDWHTARPDALSVRGARGSRVTLDGLLVSGRGMQVDGPLAEVAIRHCTLVPGWTIGPDCQPHRPAEPSLELTDVRGCVTIERTILGSIQVSKDEVGADPVAIRLADSILDATSSKREAIGAPTWPLAHAVLTFQRCTVFGEVQAHAIDLAENSLFLGRIRVARRQRGCVRFCYVTPGSRTPRRYRCQPDVAEQEVRASVRDTDNLELGFDVDGARIVVTLTNNGPKDADDVEVTVVLPACLTDVTAVASDGEFGSGAWTVGDVPAGGHAALTITATSTCTGDEQVSASVTRCTFRDSSFVDDLARRARARVRPVFTSTRYGTPGYAQLASACADEITTGADDESELGAFHDLRQPQRAADLRARLDEFVPAGTNSGIIFAS